MKPLIVFYSYSGNTRKIAEQIARETGGDLAELKTTEAYPDDYDAVVEQGQDEVNRGYMPLLEPLDVNVKDYDIVVLGSPVWWYTFAPAVKTFLHECNLSGKTVYPFATNGGWVGHTFKDVAKECPAATVKKGLDIRFDESRLMTPASEIEAWIRAID